MNKLCTLSIAFGVSCCLFAQEKTDSVSIKQPETEKSPVSFGGQLSCWSVFQFSNPVNMQLGTRFVPTFIGNYGKFDTAVSANLQSEFHLSGTKHDSTVCTLKPYRAWLRYSGNNWELRGGLQNIKFGPGKMFRPLMWFDRIDVRDPLQLTDGVYALLGRYFFQNNANIWFWSLIGNDKPKGFEFMGSVRWIPETGGRLQFPLGRGEIAFTTHYRKTDVKTALPSTAGKTRFNETRLGFDGKWDAVVGLWFESSTIITQKNNYNIPIYQDFLNIGADYTLPFGNGLGISAEYFRYHIGNRFFTNGISIGIVGAIFNYPVSILDDASAMFFYIDEQCLWFNYLSYKRAYDNLDIYLIGFWNPEIDLIAASMQVTQHNLFAGKGVQLMVNYTF
ncbi:MAG: hypothetical protein PHI70_00850 [Proteiniphilum sp.]|nr:hypothetical protein [Proteiniphilum sp.]MDD3908585.1 hypothetical protein [Proteiniphilum sp.]MDD4415327.1 hypothetical protein [Proteiniphilum sp.]